MKAVALSCPQCGGSQDVMDDQRLVECRYCCTILRVQRSANGELEQLLIENERLELENALHRLEKQWAKFQASSGNPTGSTMSGWGPVFIFAGVFTVAGTLLATFALKISNVALLTLLIFGTLLVLSGWGIRKSDSLVESGRVRFEREKEFYERRRSALETRLASADQSFERSYEDTKQRRQRLDRMSYPAADA
jgi:hypothetical protein